MSSPPVTTCLRQRQQLQLTMWRNLIIDLYPSLAKDLNNIKDENLKQQLTAITITLINNSENYLN
jgi:hypothetical protein